MTIIFRIKPRSLPPLLRIRPCNRQLFQTSAYRFAQQRDDPTSEFERPSPPRLPKELQEEFERLQKEALSGSSGNVGPNGEEMHPDARRPQPANFSGDRNPVTGEVGGPKTEPTQHGDWTYGGRATDF